MKINVLNRRGILQPVEVKKANLDRYTRFKGPYLNPATGKTRIRVWYTKKDRFQEDQELRRRAGVVGGTRLVTATFRGDGESGSGFTVASLSAVVKMTLPARKLEDALHFLEDLQREAWLPLEINLEGTQQRMSDAPKVESVSVVKENGRSVPEAERFIATRCTAWLEGLATGFRVAGDPEAEKEIQRRATAKLGDDGRWRTPDGRFSKLPVEEL